MQSCNDQMRTTRNEARICESIVDEATANEEAPKTMVSLFHSMVCVSDIFGRIEVEALKATTGDKSKNSFHKGISLEHLKNACGYITTSDFLHLGLSISTMEEVNKRSITFILLVYTIV